MKPQRISLLCFILRAVQISAEEYAPSSPHVIYMVPSASPNHKNEDKEDDVCKESGPRLSIGELIFPETPTFAFKDSVPLEEQEIIIKRLETAYPDLFNLLNTKCSIQIIATDGSSFYKLFNIDLNEIESPTDTNIESYLRQAVYDYSHNKYTIATNCTNEAADGPNKIGDRFFQSFVDSMKIATSINNDIEATIEVHPKHLEFVAKSLFTKDCIFCDENVISSERYIEDRFSILFEMYNINREYPKSPNINDDEYYVPSWLPHSGSIDFVLQDYNEANRVAENPAFHSFPFGTDISTVQTDFIVKWSARLFNHVLLDKLQSPHLMTFEMKAKYVFFEGGNICDTPNVPSLQPSVATPTSNLPTIAPTTMSPFSQDDLIYTVIGPKIKALLKFPEIPSFKFKDSVTSREQQAIVDELESAFPDLFKLLNSTCNVEFQDFGDSFYLSEVIRRPSGSTTETYSRSALYDYGNTRPVTSESFRISAECVDEYGNNLLLEHPPGANFFQLFGTLFKIPTNIDSDTGATIDSFSHRVSFETQSTFTSSLVRSENGTVVLDPNFHVKDHISFVVEMYHNQREYPRPDRDDLSPAWLPYTGSINFAVKDFEDTSRDKENPLFNAFPFGKDVSGESNDFELEWSVRLFNHDLLKRLDDLQLMTFKLKGEEILFTAAAPLETSTPSQQPYSVLEKISNSPSKYVSQSPSSHSQVPSVNVSNSPSQYVSKSPSSHSQVPSVNFSTESPTFFPIVSCPSNKSSKSTSKSPKDVDSSSKAKGKSTKSVKKSSKSTGKSCKSKKHDEFSYRSKNLSGKSNKKSPPLDVVDFERISTSQSSIPSQNNNDSSAFHSSASIGAFTILFFILV